MRLYGQRFAKRYVDRRVAGSNETRDAILWDVDTVNNLARCKIQGSNELVIAHFPRNCKTTPYWLKPGNAVRLVHRTGVRGYVELVGEGRAIPTPVEGEATPAAGSVPDGVISGCQLDETTPESMAVIFTAGTFRVNSVVYNTNPAVGGYVIMSDPAPMLMDKIWTTMDATGTLTIELDTAPSAGQFRYDLICVGTDGVIHYIAGTASATPVKPDLPADHVIVEDYIFVKGGATEIYDHDIGVDWTAPYPSTLYIVLGDAEFAWDAGDDYPETTIAVTVKDQYGNTISASPDQYLLVLEKLYGTGEIYSAESGWDADEVSQHCYSNYTFKYKRDQTTTEHSPVFRITLDQDVPLQAGTNIVLLDVSGDPIG